MRLKNFILKIKQHEKFLQFQKKFNLFWEKYITPQ